MLPDGTEQNDLLPPLTRRLDLGVPESYYETSDRPIRTLLQKVNSMGIINIDKVDACWAMEACQGDIEQALIQIGVAYRLRSLQQESLRENGTLESYESVPLHWEFQRQLSKRNQKGRNAASRLTHFKKPRNRVWMRRFKSNRKTSGGVLAHAFVFVAMFRFVLSGGNGPTQG